MVNRQQAATIADGRIHWLGSGAAPELARATVRWRGDGAENAPWYVFPLRAGRSVRVDSLQRRLTLIEGGLSGPVIVSEHAGKAAIAVTSGLLDGERNVRLISRDRHLLRLDPNTPLRWLWLLCAALLFVGAAFAAASNRAEVVVVDGLVEVHGLEPNDDALRLALEEAGS